MNRRLFDIQMPSFEDEGAPSSGGSPTPAPAPAAAPAAPAAPAATPQAPPAAATPQQPPVEGWVPSYRVRETREAAMREAQQQYAQQQRELQSQLDQYKSQIQRLVGVNPPSQSPEQDAVRQQFAKMFPKLASLEERGEDVLGLLERAGDLESQTTHYWQTYGRQSMDRLFDHASKSLGAPLTEEGKRSLHAAFTGFVQSSPELAQRYASDPTLVDEYWKAFSSSFIDPVRRSASATVVGRAAAGAATPQDSGGTPPAPAGAPKLQNLDERAAAAWASYQQNARK